MKKYTLAFFATLLVLAGTLFSNDASASHCAGGEMTYAWLRDSTYKITFKFYRDCTGAGVGSTFPLCVENNAGLPVTGFPANLNQVGPPTIATSNCTPNTCTNPSSTVPGYEEYIYEATVTLTGRATAWKFQTYLAARNPNLNLLPQTDLFWVETTLNNVASQNNSSPTFTVKPVPFVCVNKVYNYNNGVNDVNNDSLTYEMIMPRYGSCGAAQPHTFVQNTLVGQAYALPNNPLPTSYTFAIDQQSGQFTFTPDVSGIYGIAVLIREYQKGTGILLGTIIRDIQVIVRPNCPNTPPYVFGPNPPTSNNINFTSTRVEGCVSKPLNLCIRVSNADPNVALTVVSNNTFSAPGSVFSTVGYGTDTVFACIAWTPSIGDTGLHNVTYSITDTNCATNGGVEITQTYVVPLYINPVTTASPNQVLCSGQSTQLRVVGGGNFVWSVLPGGDPITSLSCTTCQEPIATPTKTTSYKVTALTSNSFCAINSDTVTVTVAPPAIFTAGPDITTCVNNTIQLDATPDPSVGTNYTISWTPATFLSNSAIPNPTASLNADTRYIVRLVPAGIANCATTDTLDITVLQGFDIANPDTAICKGAIIPVRFTGDTRYTYNWTPGFGVDTVTTPDPIITPDTSRTYTVTATFAGCRDSVRKFYVDVQPNPIVYAGPDQILCYGDTLHFDGAYINPALYPNYTYSWTPAGAFDHADSLNPIFTGFQSTTTTLTVTTPAGCIGSDSARHTVISADFLTISADTAICPGDTAQLSVGGPFKALAWTTTEYISDTSSANPFVYPLTNTTYTITGRDSNFCYDTLSTTVVVRPNALISLPDSVTIFPGDTYNISPSGNALYFSWFPAGGLSAANIANPIASPAVNTRYYVTASTEAGCSATDSIDINVASDSYIDVPNAFTPGSQPNAILRIVHRGTVAVKTFKVYNRWGAEMFSTTNVNDGWNGMLNGEPQPMGVYVYVVDAITPSGRRFYKQGNVTLIR